jgi:hypothetical protein
VRSVVEVLVVGLWLMSLGRALANISPETPINADTVIHIKKPQESCRMQVRQGCSLGLKSDRDCYQIIKLICEAY